MPTYKRYVMRIGQTIHFFTRKPNYVYNSVWQDYVGREYPNCYLQENECGFDFSEFPQDKLVEVSIKVNIKK